MYRFFSTITTDITLGAVHDVTALGGRGYQGFCDSSIKALLLKSVTTGGGGVINYQKLRDVIYGRPLGYIYAASTTT